MSRRFLGARLPYWAAFIIAAVYGITSFANLGVVL